MTTYSQPEMRENEIYLLRKGDIPETVTSRCHVFVNSSIKVHYVFNLFSKLCQKYKAWTRTSVKPRYNDGLLFKKKFFYLKQIISGEINNSGGTEMMEWCEMEN